MEYNTVIETLIVEEDPKHSVELFVVASMQVREAFMASTSEQTIPTATNYDSAIDVEYQKILRLVCQV